MKIIKNDQILIIAGKNKGKTGTVEKTFPKKKKIVIAGVNVIKKHLKPSKKNPQGGIVEFPAPIDVSNVKLICSKCGKPTRIGYEVLKDKKERKCKRCKETI